MVLERARAAAHRRIAPDHYLLRLKSPAAARRARPGQFAHILCGDGGRRGQFPSGAVPFLRRPLSIFDADPKRGTFDVIYKVVGLGTAALARIPVGERVDFLGPLGRPFELPPAAGAVWLVGGGVGIPPLFFLAKSLVESGRRVRVEAFLGARTKGWVICAPEFRRIGVPVRAATDDGTLGRRGSVVDCWENALRRAEIASPPSGARNDGVAVICGPTPMMAAAARLAARRGIPALVSLEERMGCAMGCCMGCVVEVGTEPVHSHARFQRVCTEGPVFDAGEIVWSHAG
ncbi:MAG: dihydroorotate dehydrogenase electron transfer subunit [Candidatus Omnitrophica bacterium]|nr:dihydroorotate dehydrogenase electron transfer subunit [Candidatus Omnitrophota bacterium]